MTKEELLQTAIDRGVATGLGSASMDPMVELVYHARHLLRSGTYKGGMQPTLELEACKTQEDYFAYFTSSLNEFSAYREGLKRR